MLIINLTRILVVYGSIINKEESGWQLLLYYNASMNLYHTLRFMVSVCLCVTDVGVAVTNLQVTCKTIMCGSAFTEMAILLILLFFLKIAAGLDTLRCMLHKGCHCGRLPTH